MYVTLQKSKPRKFTIISAAGETERKVRGREGAICVRVHDAQFMQP